MKSLRLSWIPVLATFAISGAICGCAMETANGAKTAPSGTPPTSSTTAQVATGPKPPASKVAKNTGQHSTEPDKVVKTEAEWKQILTPAQFAVMRKADTEPPFTGQYLHNYQPGIYVCAACNQEVFSSKTKFDSGTGWPSFWAPIAKGKIQTRTDNSDGMARVEVLCNRCGSHLGHVFEDGPKPTGLRYCMNGVALKFIKS
ncbi:MAG: peptide-methionine (R)-S-oxide reductase MsrB [Armatimonadota bacterium]|nr:peptide-methionine (R)-S-oxide reductase MsrB [Armatimonadota bacterium]